jgi:glutaminyl-peptide cyclotransferase
MAKYIFLKHKLKIKKIQKTTKQISICRPINSPNLKYVKKYVLDKLKGMNFIVEEQHFNQTIRDTNYEFSNIVAHNNTSNKNHILLGAHIDSHEICDGAIDSATSIAIILEIVRCLLKNDSNYPIMIVFFDGEEAIGGTWSDDNTLIGSKYFVDNTDLSNVSFFYLLDLIGGDVDDNKIYAYQNNPTSYSKIKKMYDINLKYKYKIFVDPSIQISLKNISDDDIPFKNKNINHLNFIPPIFPKQHHKITDTHKNVNWIYVETFANVFYEYLMHN